MNFHNELNQKIWNKDNTLKQEVYDKLVEITEAFIEYLDIPENSIVDVRLVGSSANYNYTPHSDMDVHVIVDYDKVHEDCPIVEGYLWSMKSQFNKEHDISIYKIPVEMYAEDSRTEAVSNGSYSIMNDEWIKKPEKIEPTDNDAAVEVKYNELKEACERCDDSEEAQELQDKIYQMRKAGLAKEGEFSTENLAFKKLRDDGCLDKLKQLKKAKIDKELTLESCTTLTEESEYILTPEQMTSYKQYVPINTNVVYTFVMIEDGKAVFRKGYNGFDKSVEFTLFDLDDKFTPAGTSNRTIGVDPLPNYMLMGKGPQRNNSRMDYIKQHGKPSQYESKEDYFNNEPGSPIRKFINKHKNFISEPPEPYIGNRDMDEALKNLKEDVEVNYPLYRKAYPKGLTFKDKYGECFNRGIIMDIKELNEKLRNMLSEDFDAESFLTKVAREINEDPQLDAFVTDNEMYVNKEGKRNTLCFMIYNGTLSVCQLNSRNDEIGCEKLDIELYDEETAIKDIKAIIINWSNKNEH